MKQELTYNLIEQYPELFTEIKYIECGDGWYNIINSLCLELTHEIRYKKTQIERAEKRGSDFETLLELRLELSALLENTPRFTQIKEKFRLLRIYTDISPWPTENLINLAESLSATTCEDCGNVGKGVNVGTWMLTLCDPCYNEAVRKRNS